MKRIDFENGSVTGNILGATLPMLVAQILNLLYNIVDRVYIARIPKVGTTALGAVGLCFPIIVIITAFSNLFGTGGAPLFSIYRGKKQENTADAEHGKRSIHDLDGSVFLFFSSVNRKQRCTATSEQIGECRDDHDDRKTKSYCAKCSSSYFGDSCDIDTINDVIQ